VDRAEDLKQLSFASRLAAALGVFFTALLLAAGTASAAFEQVDRFADSGESQQLVETEGGLAVNINGAGGVEPGSVYATNSRYNEVLRYGPAGDFREAWGWGVATGFEDSYQRCGPDGEPAHPECGSRSTGSWGGSSGEGVGHLTHPVGVAVDQTTGNVYVLNSATNQRLNGLVSVFSATGVPISEFGTRYTVFGESFAEGPENFHLLDSSGIAVDGNGTVYVSDKKFDTPEMPGYESRLMVFKPESPGDYEHYVYTGRSNDIDSPGGALATDSSGNIYVGTENSILEFAPLTPESPICEIFVQAAGLRTITVDPESGEPFYFSFKNGKITQLSACEPSGKFSVKSSFPATPKTETLEALAVNPTYSWSPSRPPGTLYAIDGAVVGEELFGLGRIFARAEANPPSVVSQSVSGVTSTSAGLKAQIDPKGFPTTYVFQYLTEIQFQENPAGEQFSGATEAPIGEAELGGGQGALPAAISISGLTPDTAYRFRVVARSHCEPGNEAEVCEVAGPAESFHTYPAGSAELPDGRAYELVSPVIKAGGEVFPLNPGLASCGNECKPGALSQAFPRQVDASGDAVVYEGQAFSSTEGAAVFNEYLSRRTPSGWQTTILAPKQMNSNLEGYKAFNSDLSLGVIDQSVPSLSPDAPSESPNLYVQPTADPSTLVPMLDLAPPNNDSNFDLSYAGASTDSTRRFFAANDSLTEAAEFAPAAVYGGVNKDNLYEAVDGELRLVNVLPGNAETVPGAFFGGAPLGSSNYTETTSDLSHAISDDGSRVFWSDESGQVYVREDGERTVEIPDSARFLAASSDGSKVLLRNGHLYDLESETLTDLTGGEEGFEGLVGQSEDLSHLYFVDTAVLSGEEENDQGAKAAAGKFNLYAWDGGDPAFIGTLVAADNLYPVGGDWHFAPPQRTAQASPDGRWVTFLSKAPLTGYDNNSSACKGPCAEVFLYDSASDELSCPSCNYSGAAPLGSANLPLVPTCCGVKDPMPQPRYLTNEGRLYFDTQDSLTPFDSNNGVEDVYQLEPQGVGLCERVGGCLNLISAGSEPIDSNFLAIDHGGGNVFFTTRDQLVLADRDSLVDLYVAREGGGIPAQSETPRSECQGEACQPPVSPPNDATPGSSSFEGPGNVKQKPHHKKQKKKKHKQKKHKKNAGKKSKKHSKSAKHNRGGDR
jgi:hypothetical protein